MICISLILMQLTYHTSIEKGNIYFYNKRHQKWPSIPEDIIIILCIYTLINESLRWLRYYMIWHFVVEVWRTLTSNIFKCKIWLCFMNSEIISASVDLEMPTHFKLLFKRKNTPGGFLRWGHVHMSKVTLGQRKNKALNSLLDKPYQ